LNRQTSAGLNRLALSATIHCLTGCSIGEVLGMVIGSWRNWENLPTIVVSIALAFVFGYSLTLRPLLASGLGLAPAARLAFASDTLSITVMEIVDNLFMIVVPGAMEATLGDARFWWTMAASLVLAGLAAYPVNRWLISRGRGHAVVHAHHGAENHGSSSSHHE
jgi:Domain of unknown function (DUF4396)